MSIPLQYARELKSRFGKTTPSQSTDVLTIYDNMAERSPEILKERLSGQHRELLERTPVVYLHARDLDACALTVPDTDEGAVIAIGPRFCLLLHLMMRASLWAGDNFERLDSNVFQRMARSAVALFAYYAARRPLQPNDLQGEWFFGENNWEKTVFPVATLGAISFAVCHELAHIKLGHLASANLSEMDGGLAYFAYMQEQEFAADMEGAGLYFEGCPEISFRASAPLVVCYTIGLLDSFRQLLSPQGVLPSTHPHGIDRSSRLLRRYKPTMSGAETTHSAIMCGMCEGIIKEVGGIDLAKFFPGMKLAPWRGQDSYPTLDLLYHVQKRDKKANR